MLLLLFAACHPLGSFDPPDTGAGAGEERIAVTPAVLDFGTVSVNADRSRTESFTVYNLGDVALTLSGQDEVMGSTAFTVEAAPLVSLGVDADQAFAVTFTPPTEGTFEADLLVDPGHEAVHLVGAATAPVARAGEVTFDAVVLGCTGSGTVALSNDGSEPLRLADALVSTAEFAVLDVPATVDPHDASAVLLSFTPAGGGQRGATLTLTTNDPLQPKLAVPLSVLGYEGERVTETFRYSPSNPTDLLFVVEGSTALRPALDAAGPALEAFVDTIRHTNVDYHLVSIASGEVCPARSRAYATRSDTSLQTETVLARGFTGPGGAWDDDLLGLALAALEEGDAGECLEGFRRADADLHVIVLTDGPSTADVTAELGELVAGLTEGANLRVSALLPASTTCGLPAPDYEAAVRTTGGTLGDLCAADWTEAFTELATLPHGSDPVRYPLAEVPVPSTVAVTVEGAPFTAFTYDVATNAVVFDGDAVPALGAEVTIEYVLAVACG